MPIPIPVRCRLVASVLVLPTESEIILFRATVVRAIGVRTAGVGAGIRARAGLELTIEG